jgi:hypothetical protein
MHGTMKSLFGPVFVICIGIAWLLNTLQIIPGVDWIWTVGVFLAGLATLLLGGLNRTTIVFGPFLMVASVFSVMRQTGRLHVDREVPSLVIVLGILMLISQLSRLPPAGLFQDEKAGDKNREGTE